MRLTAERGFPAGLVLGIGGAAACVAVGLLHLDRIPVSLCLFKRMTGLPCATCGTTRALARLFRLDLAGALGLNPLATLGAFAVALWALLDLALLWRGRALSLDLAPAEARFLRLAAAALFLSNWAYVIAAGR